MSEKNAIASRLRVPGNSVHAHDLDLTSAACMAEWWDTIKSLRQEVVSSIPDRGTIVG